MRGVAAVLADGGAEAGPLWLKIVIALAPPVLAAVIAGYFALSNTVDRRAERLKNLNDLRLSVDATRINPYFTLERIMLRELRALNRATLPMYKIWKRLNYAIFLFGAFEYIGLAAVWLQIVSLPKAEVAHYANVFLIVYSAIWSPNLFFVWKLWPDRKFDLRIKKYLDDFDELPDKSHEQQQDASD